MLVSLFFSYLPKSTHACQFLESYKSVTIDSMASAFDVSPSFLDQEVADLIVAGRINAKIDKVRTRVGWATHLPNLC